MTLFTNSKPLLNKISKRYNQTGSLSIQSYDINDYKVYRSGVYVKDLKEQTSETGNEMSKKVEEGTSQLPEIIKQVVDKLSGKNMEVTYDFQNLQIDVPRVSGPQGRELGSAQWKINGKFVLSTALLNETGSSEQID